MSAAHLWAGKRRPMVALPLVEAALRATVREPVHSFPTAHVEEQDIIVQPAGQSSARKPEDVHPAVDAEAAEDILSLADARAAIAGCRRCPLYAFATQAVFGEGPAGADIMFVGEQPGDQEDREGRPFVGPAGRLFDRMLQQAGIDRSRTYVTNAVKHFKFVPRGKRRLHQRPDAGEIAACRFWLELERSFVQPPIVVALGATAVRGLLVRAATITSLRGRPVALEDGSTLHVTVHPSYLLRLRDDADRAREADAFLADLRRVGTAAAALGGRPRRRRVAP